MRNLNNSINSKVKINNLRLSFRNKTEKGEKMDKKKKELKFYGLYEAFDIEKEMKKVISWVKRVANTSEAKYELLKKSFQELITKNIFDRKKILLKLKENKRNRYGAW